MVKKQPAYPSIYDILRVLGFTRSSNLELLLTKYKHNHRPQLRYLHTLPPLRPKKVSLISAASQLKTTVHNIRKVIKIAKE